MPEDLQAQNEPEKTPVIVAIPGVGHVHFPDDMSMDQVHLASKKIHENVRKLYSPDVVRPMLDTEDAGGPDAAPLPKKLPDVVIGKTPGKQFYGVRTPTDEDHQYYPGLEDKYFPGMPKSDEELGGPSEKAPTIPLGGSAGKTLVIPGVKNPALSDPDSDDWHNAMADRGSMREGWDSNPETQKAEQEKLNDPIWRRESDAQMAKVPTRLASVTALSNALDSYDKAGPTVKKKLEKQIFQKIIDYRRDAKAMDGSTKTEIDKRLAKYSNSLVKKK